MKNKKEIRAMDRAMVIGRVIDGVITQASAAEEVGVSTRQVRRIIRCYRDVGTECLIDKRGGSKPKYTEAFKAQVLAVIKSHYQDFGPTLALEKLQTLHGLFVNREYLRRWMMDEKIWLGKKRKTRVIHQSRERRPRFGELIQIDGSHHDWFEGRGPKCCLLVFIDDATSCIVQGRFEEAETTLGYFRCMEQYLLKFGRPMALYSDRYGVFTVNKPDMVTGLYGITQFQRAMKELNIEMILANSPQAKGRVERANKTLQDRLVKEMRLRSISDIESANTYLTEFILEHNTRYGRAPKDQQDGHRELGFSGEQLAIILSRQESRTLSKALEFGYNNTVYQIKRYGAGYSFRHAQVTVCEHLDGTVTVLRGQEKLRYATISKDLHKIVVADRKEANALLDKRTFKLAA